MFYVHTAPRNCHSEGIGSMPLERIFGDLRKVLDEVEAAFADAAKGKTVPASVAAAVSERLKAEFERARERAKEVESHLEKRVRHTAAAATNTLRGHPWESVALAAAVAFSLGLLLASRRGTND